MFEAEECLDQYIRLTPEIGDASEEMDDGSVKNIEALKASAEKYIQEHSADLDKIVSDLLGEKVMV